MKPKILVSRKISDLAEEKLAKEFDVTLNPKDEPIPESELIKVINDYDGMISTGFDKIGENFFNNLNGKLKIIAQVGVGYDNISINSALEKKIKVTNTPNVLNEAVAELTILLILAASMLFFRDQRNNSFGSYVVGGFLGAFVFNLTQEFFFSMSLTIQSNIVAISLMPYLLLLVIFYLTYKRI